ncbi:MAG: YihY family inner membrane protein [Xanthomonadales bacterium]|nr:YihY family inner membrane protein [Xanthomonadales bacterium]
MGLREFATRRYDREQTLAFFRFTWLRFLEDRCLQTAGALAYTSLFALVPLTAAVLGILAAFPVFDEWKDRLTAFVFKNFVPATGDVVQGYLTEFAANASKATAVGVLVLIFSAIALMMSIEDAFNRIWRVATDRRAASRFVIYWTALSLGPLLVAAALATSSYLIALPLLDAAATEYSLKARVLSVLPFFIMWTALAVGYLVIPNRSVRVRDAIVGGFIATVLFETARRGFTWYATGLANYQQVYGAMAIVPIFFFWIYLSWIIVLLGASITASLSAFDYRPASMRLAPAQEFAGLVRLVGHFADAHRRGEGLHSDELRSREPYLTDDLLQRYLCDLDRVAVIRRTESGEWILARDLAGVTLRDLYEEGDYHLPVDDVPLPGDGGRETPAALHALVRALRERLDVPLADIVADPAPAAGDIEPGTPPP